MKPITLTLEFDMSDPKDAALFTSVSAALSGDAPATKAAPVKDLPETPAKKAPTKKAPTKKAPVKKAPVKNPPVKTAPPPLEEGEIPTKEQLADIKAQIDAFVTDAVAPSNPSRAANTGVIGAELTRLGQRKISLLSPDKLPALLDFLTENVK